MDAVMIGDNQTNVSLLAGDDTWPVEARFTSPLLTATFRGGEFNCDIGKELTSIHKGKTSDCQIATNDGFIILNLKRDTLGHIEVAAEGRRYSSTEISARMVFNIDQSYLPEAIANARRVFRLGCR
jgi:hypothetical protein